MATVDLNASDIAELVRAIDALHDIADDMPD